MKKLLENSIYIVFSIMILLLLFIICLFQKMPYLCKPQYIVSNLTIIFMLFISIILIHLTIQFREKIKGKNKYFRRASIDNFVKISVLCLFVVQIYGCINIIFLSDWDVLVVWKASKEYAFTNPVKLTESFYFDRYPNNRLFMLLQAFLLKIEDAIGIFEGERGQQMSVAVINCVISSGTCYLVYKSAKLLCSQRNSLFAFLISVFSFGISPWVVINYSDAISLAFPVSVFYLYVCPRNCTWKKYTSRLLAIIIGCLSYFFKPQCFIMVIALLIIFTITDIKKDKLYTIFIASGLYLCTFLCLWGIDKEIDNIFENNGINRDSDKEFGIAHFFMMGMNTERNGIYSSEDVEFSGSFKTKKERNEANVQLGIERITKMGGLGLCKHIIKKMLVTFNDGTFAWGMDGSFYYQIYDQPNSNAAPFLRSLYYQKSERYIFFATFEQIVWIMLLLLAGCSGISIIKEKRVELMILMLSVIGLTIYFMLFEVRARYLYTYVPIFCILAAVGRQQIQGLFQKYCRIANKPLMVGEKF